MTSVRTTQQVLLPLTSNHIELATCKYSYGTLYVVVASKCSTDDLSSGWLESLFRRGNVLHQLGIFLLHNSNRINRLAVAVEVACLLYWINFSIASQHDEFLLIFPFDFWWKFHGFSYWKLTKITKKKRFYSILLQNVTVFL